jgi:hypothetical protein
MSNKYIAITTDAGDATPNMTMVGHMQRWQALKVAIKVGHMQRWQALKAKYNRNFRFRIVINMLIMTLALTALFVTVAGIGLIVKAFQVVMKHRKRKHV